MQSLAFVKINPVSNTTRVQYLELPDLKQLIFSRSIRNGNNFKPIPFFRDVLS